MRRQEARSISIDSWAREAQEQMDVIEDVLLAIYDAQAQTIKALEAGLREIAELRPIDALGSAVERAPAIAHIALREAGL